MSDEKEPTPGDETPAGTEDQNPTAAGEAQAGERVDADGLPLDREPTIDDVRSTEARHGRIALGCTLVIVLLIVAFWAVRALVIG